MFGQVKSLKYTQNDYLFNIYRDIKEEIFWSVLISQLIVNKVTLPPEGGKVTLPLSNKGEKEIFRDVKGCNWIQNIIKYIKL